MNLNAAIDWIKDNVFIVVFCILMIAAPTAMWFVSGRMNAEVSKKVDERARQDIELTQLEKTEMSLPDGSASFTGIVNDQFLERYTQVSKAMSEDAETVRKAAIDHNRKDRGVLMSDVFPEMPASMRDVLPEQFHRVLLNAYDDLLKQIRASSPPPLESMREEIEQRRVQFITQDLRKDTTDKLEPDEQKRLSEYLTNIRMKNYADATVDISFYASADQLPIPEWSQEHQPSIGEMFNWQWQFWVIDDILRALYEANKSDHSVTRAPVKQVLGISVLGLPEVDAAPSGSGGMAGGSSGRMGAMGLGGGDMTSPGEGELAGSITGPPNPKAPVSLDYGVSFTGRMTNPLYDVLEVELDLIVEVSRLPQILDMLAKHNFITVTQLALTPADPYGAAENGYIYGTAHVATAKLVLETIWLREWTKEFMPQAVKQALGVPLDQPAGSETPADVTPPSA